MNVRMPDNGRTYQCPTCKSRAGRCESCGVRLTVGEPKVNDTWTTQLTLTAKEWNLLLMAAAEFDELCEGTGYIPLATDFCDWLKPDVVTGYSDELREATRRRLIAERSTETKRGQAA